MIDCRAGGERGVGLAELVQGDVFYDGGGVCVRSQVLSGRPRVVTEVGLICSFGEVERVFEANGRVPELVCYQGGVGA